MISRVLNRCRDLLYIPGTEHLWAGRMRGSVTVLVYHRFGNIAQEDFLDLGGVPRITPEELRAELTSLQSLGAKFLTFRDLRAGNFPSAEEIGVVVTFDDGFCDSYEQGLRVLQSLGICGVVFQCTGMLSRDGLLPEHQLYRLLYSGAVEQREQRRTALKNALNLNGPVADSETSLKQVALTEVPADRLVSALDAMEHAYPQDATRIYPDAAMLKAAHAAGHEIGSHGHHHLHRETLSDGQFEHELSASSEILREVLGERPHVFSYPFGARASNDRSICSQFYQQAVTCERTRVSAGTDPLAIGRFSWPGPPAPRGLRRRRWLVSGSV